MTIIACMEKSLTKNFILQCIEGKKIGQIQGRISGEDWFSIPQYNKLSPACIPYMTIPACMVVEKSLTKNSTNKSCHQTAYLTLKGVCSKVKKFNSSKYGRKENWTNTGKNKWGWLVLNPTIQQVVTNLHTKYDHSSLHGCGEAFDEKIHKQNLSSDSLADLERCLFKS